MKGDGKHYLSNAESKREDICHNHFGGWWGLFGFEVRLIVDELIDLKMAAEGREVFVEPESKEQQLRQRMQQRCDLRDRRCCKSMFPSESCSIWA